MSFSDVFKDSFLEGFESIDVRSIAVALALSCLFAFYIFIVYRVMTRKTFYSKTFNIALAGVTVITTAIILTIQSSIVVSLGMVGALSIVRFRTAIKEPMDIAFLFWAIAAGIVLAAGLIPLAVFGSVFIGIVLLLFANHKDMSNPYILVLRLDGHESEQKTAAYLKEHTRKYTVKSKSAQKGEIELNLEIRLKDDNTDFVNELSDMDGVHSAVLVSYNGDYMG